MNRSVLLLFVFVPAFGQPGPPDPGEQKAVIEKARTIALHYTESLPNFICDQNTHRYQNSRRKENWKLQDNFIARVTYNGEREEYSVKVLNGHPVEDRSLESMGGVVSKGDFASALRWVFSPDSQTDFGWNSFASLRGRDCFLFDYSVSRDHSRWQIFEGPIGISYKSAYGGKVYIDQETKDILKVTLESAGIPSSYPVRLAKEELDYDWATIAGERYLLPYSAEIRLYTDRPFARNFSRYENYRRFAADATVTFH